MSTPTPAAVAITVLDERRCALGEGMLWHPLRGQPFWFDILGKRLLTPGGGWDFDGHVSAAGWVDHDRLLVAGETALMRLDLRDGSREAVTPLEADIPGNRSNDGRADPWGGFWIGTMGKGAAAGAGAIWRLHRGELRRIVPGLTIPNAIAFDPDGSTATYADTAARQVWRIPLGRDGWPAGEARPFLDLRDAGLNPDGAVFDDAGNLWIALWGAGRVAAWARDGREVARVDLPAQQPACPGFGGPALDALLVTSAAVGLSGPDEGRTFRVTGLGVRGLAEHRVLL